MIVVSTMATQAIGYNFASANELSGAGVQKHVDGSTAAIKDSVISDNTIEAPTFSIAGTATYADMGVLVAGFYRGKIKNNSFELYGALASKATAISLKGSMRTLVQGNVGNANYLVAADDASVITIGNLLVSGSGATTNPYFAGTNVTPGSGLSGDNIVAT
jgi:hypothetical protein